MHIRILKTLCDIIDTGSLSRAARLNHVTQSAVSQQLAKAEDELGTALIRRGGGMAAATEAGKIFYDDAREILGLYEKMLGDVRSVADTVRGVLRVGTIDSVGFYLLDAHIREFLRAHPEVDLQVGHYKCNRITAAMLGGQLDLALVACPERHRSVEVIPLAEDPLVMVCCPRHRLASRKKVSPSNLEGEAFIAFEAGMPTRVRIDRLLKEHLVTVRIAREFDNIETVKRAVEIDQGLSILPLAGVERSAARGHLAYAPFRDPTPWVRQIGVLRPKGKAPSKTEQAFLDILRPA